MDNLTELLSDSMEFHARQAGSAQLPARVGHRLRRNRRLRTSGVSLVVAGSLTAGLWGVAALRGGPELAQPAAGLATAGECAGLTVVIGAPNPGEGDRSERPPLDPVALRPGDNAVTMARGDSRWLQASGPCRDRLAVDAPDQVVAVLHVDAAPGSDGSATKSGPFQDLGSVSVAEVYTETKATESAGQFTVRIAGPCDPGPCPLPATVRVSVQGAGGPDKATTPGSPAA